MGQVKFWGLVFLFFSSGALASERYMVCKGGPGMWATLFHYTDNGKLGVEMTGKFKKGKTAGTPKKGECVWRFFGMTEVEPEKFRFYTPAPNSQHFAVNHKGIFVGQGPLLELIYAIRNQKEFRVMAELSNTLITITRLGWT